MTAKRVSLNALNKQAAAHMDANQPQPTDASKGVTGTKSSSLGSDSSYASTDDPVPTNKTGTKATRPTKKA